MPRLAGNDQEHCQYDVCPHYKQPPLSQKEALPRVGVQDVNPLVVGEPHGNTELLCATEVVPLGRLCHRSLTLKGNSHITARLHVCTLQGSMDAVD